MSLITTALDLIPTAYSLTMHSGVRCLCLASRPAPNKLMLVYLPLNETALGTIQSASAQPDFRTLASVLGFFSHLPYTPLLLVGEMSLEESSKTVTYMLTSLAEWHNNESKQRNSKLLTLYFDIEVDGTGAIFPTPELNKITCISYQLNKEPATVLTTFPLTQLGTVPVNYRYFEDELSLILFFLDLCLTVDHIVQYNGNRFDWHFLLAVLHKYTFATRFWSDLSQREGRSIRLETAFFPTPFGMKERFVLLAPGLEHIDLLTVCQRLFPYWPDHKLDTAGKELTRGGKYAFSMENYFDLVAAVAGAASSKEPLTPKSIALLREALRYSELDCSILSAIHEALLPYRLLAEEFCYLCASDWCNLSEAEGLLTKLEPDHDQPTPTPAKLKLKVGLHNEVGVSLVKRLLLRACTNKELKTLLEKAVSRSGTPLTDFLPLLAQLYSYSTYFDPIKYEASLVEYFSGTNTDYVGTLGAYTYVKDKDFDCVYNYRILAVPAPSSWLSFRLEENKQASLLTKGKAKLCQALPARIEQLLAEELVVLAVQPTGPRLGDYVKEASLIRDKLFFGTVDLAAFTEKTTINLSNYVTKLALLTPEEQKYLRQGGDFVTIETVETTTGTLRVRNPYPNQVRLNEEYYLELLLANLTALNKLVAPVKSKRASNKVRLVVTDAS